MMRAVKHLSLHRIAGTELRVVADVEDGVMPVIQVEEEVIRRYVEQQLWSHRWLTLFILEDLQPLTHQLPTEADLPPGGVAAMNDLPLVNLYDLADPTSCHVFVNRLVMVKEGYWGDLLAIRGLLAHEHAHPSAENGTTRASRRLDLDLELQSGPFAFSKQPPNALSLSLADNVHRQLAILAQKVCLYAPREIFANQVTIAGGFGDALLHLDRRNVTNASRSVAGRDKLRQQLQEEILRGNLTLAESALLLLIGDLKGYLEFALETAPFYRTGRESDARELEAVLETQVFPLLEPQVAPAYLALRDHYIALDAKLTPSELMAWGNRVLEILEETLAEKGLVMRHRLHRAGRC